MMLGFPVAAAVLLSIAPTFVAAGATLSANSTDPQVYDGECNVTEGIKAPNPFTPVFYDMECLAKMNGKLKCPMDVADEFIEQFAGDLRIEATALTIAQFFCVVCMLLTASIPVPAEGDRKGLFLWAVWMLLQLCHAAFSILGLVMMPLVFSSASHFVGDCAVQFRGLAPLLSVASLIAAYFHPAVAALAGSVASSLDSVVQGSKLLEAARRDTAGCCVSCVCLVLVLGSPVLVFFLVLLPTIVHTVCFMASIAVGFGLAIFAPVSLAIVACLGLVTALMLGLAIGLGQLMPAKASTMLRWVPELTLDPSLVTEAIEALGALEGCHALSSVGPLIATLKLPVTASSIFRDWLSGQTGKTGALAALAVADLGQADAESLAKYQPSATLFGVKVAEDLELDPV